MSGDGELERLRAENAALRARLGELEGSTDSFLESILRAVPAYIMRVDASLRIRYVNRIQPDLTLEDVVGHSVFEHIDDDHVDVARECIERVLETGELGQYEAVGRGQDGGTAHYLSYVAPIPGEGGSDGVCLVALEVTEQKRQEAALRESEQKLRVAIEATGIGLWSWDLDTGEVVWDARMKEICGLEEEPAGLPAYIDELVHEDDQELVRESGAQTMETGQFVSRPHRIVRPDGQVRWILTSGTVFQDEQGNLRRMVGGQLDITDQRETQDQLHHSQKIDAVGSLTAGIAHNFNNMLMVITPTLELLERTELSSPHDELVRDARQAAERAADMVRQLMTFAGQGPTGLRRSRELEPMLSRVLRMCEGTFEPHITLSNRIAEPLPSITADLGALEQVVLNVLLNARDAVAATGRARGHVELAAEAIEVDRPPPGQSTGAYVCLRIVDDGVGVPENVQHRVFEPFFTTKGLAEGTGLGLATSYAIVKEHEGWIELDSEPGSGTVLTIFLPVEGTVETAPEAGDGAPEPPASARVLVVDDEPAILQLVERLLEPEGHEVLTAETGKEALDMLADRAVDLILLDRAMPNAPGYALVGALRQEAPGARLVYFTGQDVPDEERAEVDAIVHKPATSEELSHRVRELLRDGTGEAFA